MIKNVLFLAYLSLSLLTIYAQRPIDGLAHRILGDCDTNFRFAYQPDTVDFFTLSSKDNKIVITGNNDNSLAMGLNYYLKHYAHVHISWFKHDLIELPQRFPTVEQSVRRQALVGDRFFLNYCTYGYTMPWWQWEQWEHFIDWMALNGINLPLAITGQEAIWYDVWKALGLSDQEIRSYFSGPAHLPWHRMANLDGFGGPLPQSWLESQKALQKQIVARERELNMTPVLPAFAGHVPQRFAELHPNADIKQLSAWCGFEPTYFLNSSDSLFSVIQKLFMKKMIDQFGTDHIYGVDPFNEMDPPSWEPDYLSTVSQNIYQSMANVDPAARWLQMTWVFYYKRKSWTPERLKAYLTAVPTDKLVLLDYFCEKTEVWRTTEGFYNQPFIWCYLGNFGGNTMLVGNIKELEDKLSATLRDAGHNLSGIGSTLESFDVSPHIYEYLFERAWNSSPSLEQWTNDWAATRTGKRGFEKAWKTLVDSIYLDWSFYGLGTQLVARPTLDGHGTYYTKPFYSYNNDTLWSICQQLFQGYEQHADVEGFEGRHKRSYDYDIVNFLSQWLGNQFMQVRNAFTNAYKQGNLNEMRRQVRFANQIFVDAEALLSTHPSFMLGSWIKQARAMGTTSSEKDYYEQQARTLLTIWGGPILNDYANRMWSGLVSDYYAKRWNLFFEAVINAVMQQQTFDEKNFDEELSKFESSWPNTHTQYPSMPIGDTRTVARSILSRYHDGGRSSLPVQEVQTGDLLFVGLPKEYNTTDGSDMASAIAEATDNKQGINYIHVAILEVDSCNQIWTIDATTEHGVNRHPLDTFLRDFTLEDGSYPIFTIMRLKNNKHAADYVNNAKKYIGQPYDLYFLPDNEAKYCSELVWDAFVTPKGKHLFHNAPMNFKAEDGTFPSYWQQLFEQLGQPIPQGTPGTNPNAMQKEKILFLQSK